MPHSHRLRCVRVPSICPCDIIADEAIRVDDNANLIAVFSLFVHETRVTTSFSFFTLWHWLNKQLMAVWGFLMTCPLPRLMIIIDELWCVYFDWNLHWMGKDVLWSDAGTRGGKPGGSVLLIGTCDHSTVCYLVCSVESLLSSVHVRTFAINFLKPEFLSKLKFPWIPQRQWKDRLQFRRSHSPLAIPFFVKLEQARPDQSGNDLQNTETAATTSHPTRDRLIEASKNGTADLEETWAELRLWATFCQKKKKKKSFVELSSISTSVRDDRRILARFVSWPCN